MIVIGSFTGPYRFLSNFYESPVTMGGVDWPSAEHAFQFLKIEPGSTDAQYWIEKFAADQTPQGAKRLGRQVPLMPDWDTKKFGYMEFVLKRKFEVPELRQKLLATGNLPLIEGNTWHDQIWGDCVCPQHVPTPGHNALGVLLMRLRLNLQVGIDE